ncbi:hypothetical protein L7F22_050536 [Adiantum nelumboides]|nr:hypothetical protein [Adiantum nelumboides]
MRDQGDGASVLTEKKVRVKIGVKDECTDGRWRANSRSSYHEGSNEGGRAILNNNQISSMMLSGGRLKGGSVLQARHLAHGHVLGSSVISEIAFAEDGPLGSKKRTAEEESGLPHWGQGKRCRGSRLEPLKQSVSGDVGLSSKSHGRSAEKALPLPAPKVRGTTSKLSSNKTSANLAPRNGFVSKTSNGVVHTDNNSHSPSLRQRGAERDLIASQHKCAEDHGICRQLQKGDGIELATPPPGRSQSDGHVNRTIKNADGACRAQTLIHMNNVSSNSLCEPLSLVSGLKSRADTHILEWPRIVLSLTRKEKEDDFLVFKGSKLPQRPKKRPKIIERALHYCTPGNWLIDLSRVRYDVREKKSGRKKPRGLKAMESLESETE